MGDIHYHLISFIITFIAGFDSFSCLQLNEMMLSALND